MICLKNIWYLWHLFKNTELNFELVFTRILRNHIFYLLMSWMRFFSSLVSVKWLLSAFVWTCLLAFFAGISADTLHCDLIDQQCNCFQPHTLRCHLNTSSHLREVLQSFRANTNISKDVKLLDLTVDSLYSLPEDIFKNISIAGLLVSFLTNLLLDKEC